MSIQIALADVDAELIMNALQAWCDEHASGDEGKRATGIMSAIRSERAERDRRMPCSCGGTAGRHRWGCPLGISRPSHPGTDET